MTYRDSAIATNSSSGATSVQVTVPGTVQPGDLLLFVLEKGTTNSSADSTLSSSNGGTFTQIDPPGSGLGSVGTQSKYAAFSRTAVTGDAGSTVTGQGSGTGRRLLTVVALSGVDAESLVVAATSPGFGTSYGFPASVPAPGSQSGTAVRVALGSLSSVGNTFTLPQGSPVTERQQATTSGSTGPNVFGFVGTQEFTGEQVPAATVEGSESTSNKRTLTFTASASVTPTVTATAPADVSVQAGGPTFALTGQDSTTGGATVTDRTWSRVSGEVVTLANTNQQTVNVTPPASPGTGSTTLRYAVAGTPGALSDSDDVVVTWTPAATNPITYTQSLAHKIDARAFTGQTTMAQIAGATAQISEDIPNLFYVSGPGTFRITDDAGVEAPVDVVVTAVSLTAASIEELVWDGTAFV